MRQDEDMEGKWNETGEQRKWKPVDWEREREQRISEKHRGKASSKNPGTEGGGMKAEWLYKDKWVTLEDGEENQRQKYGDGNI